MLKVSIVSMLFAALIIVGGNYYSAGTRRFQQSRFDILVLSHDYRKLVQEDGGLTPKNMDQFLLMWEGNHSACVNGRWYVSGSNIDRLIGAVKGVRYAPGNKSKEVRVIAVLDGWRKPIGMSHGVFHAPR
jgi:hypothetical protein